MFEEYRDAEYVYNIALSLYNMECPEFERLKRILGIVDDYVPKTYEHLIFSKVKFGLKFRGGIGKPDCLNIFKTNITPTYHKSELTVKHRIVMHKQFKKLIAGEVNTRRSHLTDINTIQKCILPQFFKIIVYYIDYL